MTWIPLRPRLAAVHWLAPLVLGAGLVTGCGLLDVSNPLRTEEEDIGSSMGADLLRKDALTVLAEAVAEGALVSGTLTDEFFWDPRLTSTSSLVLTRDALDRRESESYEGFFDGFSNLSYGSWQDVRRTAGVAMSQLRTYMLEPARSAYLGQMLAVRGVATLRLAEDFCPGFPLNEMVNDQLVPGESRTTVEAFEQALADLDSAVVYAADSARIRYFAQIGRARALLGLGRFAEAAAAVAGVPTSYVRNVEFSSSVGVTHAEFGRSSGRRWSVADREGGNGLDFVAAVDPRVLLTPLEPTYDENTDRYTTATYLDSEAPIVLASGIEARLIEAEAALHADPDALGWLTTLNQLRQTVGLADTTDPGTEAARVDLLFRERAFWLFGTGHRLGDLRRLIAHYGRDPETVFPSGPYRLGGVYGTATSIPFPAELEAVHNPAVTGCTSR